LPATSRYMELQKIYYQGGVSFSYIDLLNNAYTKDFRSTGQPQAADAATQQTLRQYGRHPDQQGQAPPGREVPPRQHFTPGRDRRYAARPHDRSPSLHTTLRRAASPRALSSRPTPGLAARPRQGSRLVCGSRASLPHAGSRQLQPDVGQSSDRLPCPANHLDGRACPELRRSRGRGPGITLARHEWLAHRPPVRLSFHIWPVWRRWTPTRS
jgi:hypothetical protein